MWKFQHQRTLLPVHVGFLELWRSAELWVPWLLRWSLSWSALMSERASPSWLHSGLSWVFTIVGGGLGRVIFEVGKSVQPVSQRKLLVGFLIIDQFSFSGSCMVVVTTGHGRYLYLVWTVDSRPWSTDHHYLPIKTAPLPWYGDASDGETNSCGLKVMRYEVQAKGYVLILNFVEQMESALIDGCTKFSV